ncbi:S41 family peptidase [Chondromyces crocatus]|uniref:Peptidase S41 n=1 Tax=Chondromyces crocatus TaxID=52 RepID=A0A0K1EGR7_CHOCO|nr:S41 family peptidase [Chondromyces crocatus]AKT39882.1 peptidase S41 [Chondromyces crocatus]
MRCSLLGSLLVLHLASCAAPSGTSTPAPHAAEGVGLPPVTRSDADEGAIVPEVPPVTVPPSGPLDARVERLARLAKVWGEVRYLHPFLVERDIDWDAALLKAIPKVSAATTGEDEDAAVEEMLKALGDPATRLDRDGAWATSPDAVAPAFEARFRWEGKGKNVLWIDLGSVADDATMVAFALRAQDEIAKARAVIADMRPPAGQGYSFDGNELFEGLVGSLASREGAAPALREVEHHGYASQRGNMTPYQTSLVTRLPALYPFTSGPRPSRIVVLVDKHSSLPAGAVALQSLGDAEIVSDGVLQDEAIVSQISIERGDRPPVLLRISSLEAPLRADVALPEGQGARPAKAGAKDAMIEKALAMIASGKSASGGGRVKGATQEAKRQVTPARSIGWRRDAVYEDQPYPSRELRLLGLFRLWNVFERFFAYRSLMGDAWERALVEFIPRFEAAEDARAYTLTIAEMAARVPDGHVWMVGRPSAELFGVSLNAGIDVLRIEGRPVVVRLSGRVARGSGLAVGDVIVSVDGEDIDARAQRARRYEAASNPWAHAHYADRQALRGAPGSVATLGVEGEGGRRKEVKVPRYSVDDALVKPGPDSDALPYRLLDGGIGYVDLTWLEGNQVDAMFTALASAKGIVFDMRGYPHQTGWALGAGMNVKKAPTALFERPVVSAQAGRGRFLFEQRLPPAPLRFQGPSVMLVDERTQSQAEHIGLLFSAANGTRFVGSPTAGANGDITDMCMPGGTCVTFSGQGIRFGDGRQLQRIGLSPLVPVRPTIAGLRAGKDEVLARGVEVLRREIAARALQPATR